MAVECKSVTGHRIRSTISSIGTIRAWCSAGSTFGPERPGTSLLGFSIRSRTSPQGWASVGSGSCLWDANSLARA
ncbi:unnamed protein product [Mycena citricolor]|uniref:Uncharacterized protein n=1 Tax=Mycena citricolor TaxID=2018698 RepID=A0AAD2HXL8_9AGAR|nr:unnamed protein product [Mycena citricolor]